MLFFNIIKPGPAPRCREVTAMKQQDLLQYPEAYAFFSPHLSAEDYREMRIRRFPAGSALMEESCFDDNAVYYMLEGVGEGSCSILKDLENGLYYVPIKLEKNSFVGISEALEPTPVKRLISIFAKSDVVALKIPKAQLHRWAREKPEFLMIVFSKVLALSWKQRAVVSSCNSHGTDVKLAAHLQYLYTIYASSCYPPGYEGEVRLLDTHQEIAHAVGCSGRTVDRAINSLSKSGRITIRRGKIHIDKAQYEALLRYVEGRA